MSIRQSKNGRIHVNNELTPILFNDLLDLFYYGYESNIHFNARLAIVEVRLRNFEILPI